MNVTYGSVLVSTDANFFHPRLSVSDAVNRIEPLVHVVPAQPCTIPVTGIDTRPAAHELDQPFANDADDTAP